VAESVDRLTGLDLSGTHHIVGTSKTLSSLPQTAETQKFQRSLHAGIWKITSPIACVAVSLTSGRNVNGM